MNLAKKKILAAKVLNVGKERIVLNSQRLSDIKEAITKQDIRDLYSQGAISIKEVKGRKKLEKRNRPKREGSIRKHVKKDKLAYIFLARKQRAYLASLRKSDKLTRERYIELRKKIKARFFKNKNQLREALAGELK